MLAAAEHEDVVYAVPGHPWVGEATTPLLLAQAQAHGAEVTIIGGMSFVAPAFAAAGVDLMDGSQVCDAMLLARQHYPQVETSLPLLAAQVYARWLASDLKLTLLAAYPPDHEVVVLRGAGTAAQAVERLPLEELDRSDRFDHLTSVYVPPLAAYGSFSALLELVAHLRAPEGCPWDREQTLESLRQDLLDEAAEVMEAIDLEADGRDNSRHIAEELGDLYLVASMLTQIATEEGRFQIGDVMRGVVTKLIRRHPHVFSDVEVSGVDNVLTNWDAIKAQEKAEQGIAPHPLDGVPAALPALEKARKLQSKAAKLGWLDRSALAGADPNLAAAVGTVARRGTSRRPPLAARRHRPSTRPQRRKRAPVLRGPLSRDSQAPEADDPPQASHSPITLFILRATGELDSAPQRFYSCLTCACSSVEQSTCLRNRVSGVRIPPGVHCVQP